jgi:hypothetical protein
MVLQHSAPLLTFALPTGLTILTVALWDWKAMKVESKVGS